MQNLWTLLSWGPQGWMDDIAYGVFITVSLALATLPVGLAIGFLASLAKQSDEPSLRLAGDIYTTIFRGLPELLTLFLVFYGAQIGIQKAMQFFSPGTTVEVNSFISGMVALGPYSPPMPARCSCRPSEPSRKGSTRGDMPSACRTGRPCVW